MKNICLLLIGIFLLASFKSEERYSIQVEIINCNLTKKYHDWIYLIRDGKKLDSVNTYKYKDYFLFQFWMRNTKFKFKGLAPGDYQIKYTPKFNFDSLITVPIVNRDEKVSICFDDIPLKAYSQATMVDDLARGDTLFINSYIAAGGEFGGYDEGLWIWAENNSLKGKFYKLENTYGLDWEHNRREFYSQNKTKAKAISKDFTLTERTRQHVKNFLIETRNYNEGTGFGNAPEFITVYTNTDSYQIIEHDFDWKPYLKLKENLQKLTNKRK